MFKEIIEALLKAGLTESEIAARVGATQPSINRIKRGRQNPGYELGVKLHDLKNELCKKAA